MTTISVHWKKLYKTSYADPIAAVGNYHVEKPKSANSVNSRMSALEQAVWQGLALLRATIISSFLYSFQV
jgi:hypothetical protein